MSEKWALREGETPFDLSQLTHKHRGRIRNRGQLDKVEAEAIRKAYVKYLANKPSRRVAPFDYTWLLKVHREMFGDVWTFAGNPRDSNVNMGEEWGLVPLKLSELVDDIRFWYDQKHDRLDQSMRIHHKAVSIHPFLNGNGRWARMLGNIWLRQHGQLMVQWPENGLVGTESAIRKDYIAAVQAADAHDYGPLFALHDRYQM